MTMLAWLLSRGLIARPLHRLFAVASCLVALLTGDDVIPTWGYQLWKVSWVLPDGNLLGRGATAMVSYSARPMGVQIVAWAVTLTMLFAGGYAIQARSRPSRGTSSNPA